MPCKRIFANLYQIYVIDFATVAGLLKYPIETLFCSWILKFYFENIYAPVIYSLYLFLTFEIVLPWRNEFSGLSISALQLSLWIKIDNL